ncbi:hypothetical protein OG21DRAFT_1407452 [Imleria badia]|nr:hypothetical protein OG21DRAFT_1407452 [Imleria badia]
MLTHREFSAWIVSEGKPLREYLIVVDSNASKVLCWMREAGKVRYGDKGSRTFSCSFITLDDFQVPGRFLTGYGKTSREGVRMGSNTREV